MKAFFTLAKRTIPKKHTFFRMELNFAIVVGVKVWPTCTPKHFEERYNLVSPSDVRGC
jgi:hypothetical protein